MLSKMRLWIRMIRKIPMRGLGIAIGLAYIGVIATEMLTNLCALISISIIVAVLVTKGDEWLSSVLRKMVEQPSYGVKTFRLNYLQTNDTVIFQLFFTNNSHRAIYIENLDVRGNYTSIVFANESYFGKDSIKLKSKLKFGETMNIEVPFLPSEVLAQEIQGAVNQNQAIPLEFSFDWDTKVLGISVNYFSHIKYNNFPVGDLK